jgi:pimeloyl-ACP methyl ester carboxylesterase
VFDMLRHTDPALTEGLAARLPVPFRETIERFSPGERLRNLRVPLFIMQSADDPATPPISAEIMHGLVPGSRLATLEYFHHVRPGGAGSPLRGRIRDLRRAWSFVSWVLAAQE